MSGNLRDKILNSQDRTSEPLDLPEWGVKVEVRSMKAADRIDYLEARQNGGEPLRNSLWQMVLNCTYDPETGDKVFDEADRDTMQQKAAGPYERLWKAAIRVSGLSEEAAAEQAAAFQEEPGT